MTPCLGFKDVKRASRLKNHLKLKIKKCIFLWYRVGNYLTFQPFI